jgi:putative addiction module component (TIGR02574 family)
MAPDTLTELLKLSPSERAELAMALWASLDDTTRSAELALTPEQVAEFEQRFAEHEADPDSARPWADVQRSLQNRQ